MNWRKIQKTNFTKFEHLIDFLKLDPLNRSRLSLRPPFPLNLPRRLASKMEKNNLEDPLFLQFVPLDYENNRDSGFTSDPVDDQSFQLTPKLLKKYQSRALMLPTSACAMHCRYCFRQNYPYESSISDFTNELNAIRGDTSLQEIILSGGDPLSLSDEKLHELLTALDQIEHIELIRFHTRFLIGIPERVTKELIDTLSKVKKQLVFVFHINHPREIDCDVKRALHLLSPYQKINQSVLLRGVNDTLSVQKELSLSLIKSGILPYYLHQLDRVHGTSHFDVDQEEGLNLIEDMRQSMPGYLVPRYVQEIPHKPYKTLLHSV